MDEFTLPQGTSRFPPRLRTSSVKSSSSPRQSKLSLELSQPEQPPILSPTPRRHLLETSESQRWLRTPPLSPSSSRAASPAIRNFNQASSWPRHRDPRHRHLSFSSLTELEKPASVPTSHHHAKSGESADGEAGMGKRWIRWMHRQGMKGWVVPCAVIASTWVKWCIGLGSYSGHGTPPMFGDYEAQRHWMELTIHLPIHKWYTYDLQYWGLDYPPLTAYISYLCGIVGVQIEPSWFALDKSRGIESEGSKTFMRATVLLLDALIYVPALFMFVRTWLGSRSRRTQNLALLTLLLQPSLLLVDFGHFQYNSVMLALTLFAINFFAAGQDLLGAVCFVLSLGFKQMALYYSPAIGSYLLGKCLYLGPAQGSRLFIRLAFVTVFTFLIVFLPFLPPFAPLSAIFDPINRIFPFNRGLFEDKVANFWCASDVVFKWRNRGSPSALVKLSAGLTALGFLPSAFVLIQGGIKIRTRQKDTPVNTCLAHTPTLPLLPYALLTASMSFFMFSFQVHEKTILLPLLPINLLLSGSSTDSTLFAWGALANNIAVFSMWPLLRRDGLVIQYVATLLLWNRLIGYNPLRLHEKSFIRVLSLVVYGAGLCLHIFELVFTPPARYPDIFPMLNVLVSAPVFALVWLWSVKCSVEVSWALGGPSSGTRSPAGKQPAAAAATAATTAATTTNGGLVKDVPAAGGSTSVGINGRREGDRVASSEYAQKRRRVPFGAPGVGVSGDPQ